MKLICVVCERAIEVGEPLLANPSGELAHQSCVESRSEIRVQLPTVTVLSPKVAVPAVDLSTRPASGSSTVPEPCLLPPAPPKTCPVCRTTCGGQCSVCGAPCIGHCPVCLRLVCQDFGYNGANCAGRHESSCPDAAKQRMKNRVEDTYVIVKVQKHRNGKKSR